MKSHLQHRLRRDLRRLATILAVTVLSLATILPIAAMAAEQPTGTLTIRPKYGDKVLTASEYNGTFKIYHIADYAETGVFTKDAALTDLDVKIDSATLTNDESYKQLTQTISAYVKDHKDTIEPIHTAIKVDEPLTLRYGLYLITSDQLAKGYKDHESFLAMIPEFSESGTNVNVTAYPKVSPEPDEPDEPHKPHEPSTPPSPQHYGKVVLGKSDAETAVPLQGVVFNLYRQDGDTWTLVGTYTTNAEGVIYVDQLPYGNYYFQEAQTLDGYILDQTPQTFAIDSEDTVKIVMTNTPIPETPEEIGGFTGDNSNMTLYGIVVAAAAVSLVAWFVWKRKNSTNR